MNLAKVFISLSHLFKENGFNLYLVGGTARDYLLSLPLTDYDFATDATIEEMARFLNVKETYSSLGSMSIKYENIKCDITTLREESGYLDYRHPSKIKFIKDLSIDSNRRDFTINAIYIDEKGKIYDFHNGVNDLKNKLIKMIGDPNIRLKEDPLRILRAIRFSLIYNFKIDDDLIKAIKENASLLKKLSLNKVLNEIKKMPNDNLKEILKSYNINFPIPNFNLKERYVDLSEDSLEEAFSNNVLVKVTTSSLRFDPFFVKEVKTKEELIKNYAGGYLSVIKLNKDDYLFLKKKYNSEKLIPYDKIKKDLLPLI